MSSCHNTNASSSDDLMGLIVHSYNNYLAGIMGYLELALLECENTEVEDRLKRSLGSGIEAVHFGKTILASVGRLQVPLQSHSLASLLNAVNEKQVEFDLDLNMDIGSIKESKIKTDPIWFKECLMDLIEFIVVASKEKKIGLNSTIDQQSQRVNIIIRGEGVQLSDEEIEFLFEPFYSSRKIIGKKDIGLAKAKGFLAQMNADLCWQNNKGFMLNIPIEL